MNAITPSSTAAVPAFPTKLAESTVAGVQRLKQQLQPEGEGNYSISKASTLTVELRAGLERRVSWIDAWHRPCGEDQVRPWIELMLGTLRMKLEDDEDADLRKRAYCLAMADLPIYAVQAACTMALRGKIGDGTGKWAPQPGELHVAAEQQMQALLREQADISRVLKAVVRQEPVLTEEDRKAVVARIRKEMGMPVAGTHAKPLGDGATDHPDKRRAADYRDDPREAAEWRLGNMDYQDRPLTLSPAALATLKRTSDAR